MQCVSLPFLLKRSPKKSQVYSAQAAVGEDSGKPDGNVSDGWYRYCRAIPEYPNWESWAALYLTEILTTAAVALHCSIGCVIAFTNETKAMVKIRKMSPGLNCGSDHQWKWVWQPPLTSYLLDFSLNASVLTSPGWCCRSGLDMVWCCCARSPAYLAQAGVTSTPFFSKSSHSFRALYTFWFAVPALLGFFTLKGKHATLSFSLELIFLFL